MRDIPENNIAKIQFPVRRITTDDLWDRIFKVIQSNEQFRDDSSFVVEVKHVEDRRGRGGCAKKLKVSMF